MTFPGKPERLGAVQVVGALDIGVAIYAEGVIGFHVNAAHGVNDAFKAAEVHADIVVNFLAVELFQCADGTVNTINAGMGQLVFGIVLFRECYKVVSWSVNQLDRAGLGVDRGKDVDVTAAFDVDAAVGVYSADINKEGAVFGAVGGAGVILNRDFDFQCIQGADFVGKAFVALQFV